LTNQIKVNNPSPGNCWVMDYFYGQASQYFRWRSRTTKTPNLNKSIEGLAVSKYIGNGNIILLEPHQHNYISDPIHHLRSEDSFYLCRLRT
jgi:hypothetical protein